MDRNERRKRRESRKRSSIGPERAERTKRKCETKLYWTGTSGENEGKVGNEVLMDQNEQKRRENGPKRTAIKTKIESGQGNEIFV
ncbi:hypothetical protein NST02_02670 [Robertmurraya sp. FSL W8-0741]|uniref:hypothetical protein n=1 Tax=Robertmurraya sp. FSL W8-0741 TaxID=2954629 RepID=UPI0030FB3C0B